MECKITFLGSGGYNNSITIEGIKDINKLEYDINSPKEFLYFNDEDEHIYVSKKYIKYIEVKKE